MSGKESCRLSAIARSSRISPVNSAILNSRTSGRHLQTIFGYNLYRQGAFLTAILRNRKRDEPFSALWQKKFLILQQTRNMNPILA